MVINSRDIRSKRWDYGGEKFMGKGKFWVWRGTEMEWWIMKVLVMMMMMNWWEKDEMTVVDCVVEDLHKSGISRCGITTGRWPVSLQHITEDRNFSEGVGRFV